MRMDSAITGGQQTFIKGVETDTAITGTEFEWQFPQIEVDPTLKDVSGNSSTPFTSRISVLQPPGTGGTANCSWHFSKGAPGSLQMQSSPAAAAALGMNASTMTATTLSPVKSSLGAGQSGSNTIAASASPNVQTTSPQSSTMNCSHWNSIPAIPTSPASQAASHAYSTDCTGSFSNAQNTPVANLVFPQGHYFLMATVTPGNFSTSTLSQQHYTCSIGFGSGQSKTLIFSAEGNGPQQTTLMTLTVNGPATSAEVDCAAYQGVSASARTSIIAIEVGAMN